MNLHAEPINACGKIEGLDAIEVHSLTVRCTLYSKWKVERTVGWNMGFGYLYGVGCDGCKGRLWMMLKFCLYGGSRALFRIMDVATSSI